MRDISGNKIDDWSGNCLREAEHQHVVHSTFFVRVAEARDADSATALSGPGSGWPFRRAKVKISILSWKDLPESFFSKAICITKIAAKYIK